MKNQNKSRAARAFQTSILLSLGLGLGGSHAFAQEGSPDPAAQTEAKAPTVVKLDPGSLTGGDLGDNPTVTVDAHCSASIENPPVSDDTMDVSGPTWSLSGGGSFLDDGLPATDPAHDPSASGSATFKIDTPSAAASDYHVTFDSPGDYVDTLTATATYQETMKTGPDAGKVVSVSFSNIANADGTNDGNPGTPDPDGNPPSSGTPPPSAATSATPRVLVPYGAPPLRYPPPAPTKIAQVGGGYRVYITSSLDPTYHKGSVPASGGDPSRDKDPIGAINTISHLLGTTISYHANMKGTWPTGSHYLWHDSWGDPDDGKTDQDDFSGTSIPNFPVTYGFLAKSSHVYVHLTPHTPSITGNSYVTFHDTIENVQLHTEPDQDHPRPTNPTNDNYDAYNEWTKIGPTQDKSAEFESSVKGGIKATIGVDTTVGVEGEASGITSKVEQTYSVENETEYEVESVTKDELEFKEGYLYYIFWGLGWTRHFGTYDVYDEHGYKGRGHWHADIPQFAPGTHKTKVIFRTVIAGPAE